MNKLYFIVLLFSFCEKLIATNPPDAISLSLGGSAAAYSSPFCIQYNPANLVYSPSNIAFNTQNRYGIRDYSGIRYYILFRYTTLSNTQLWFKYGYTQHDTPIESFDEQYAIGSGLNEVAGNKKYTFTLQLKHVFN